MRGARLGRHPAVLVELTTARCVELRVLRREVKPHHVLLVVDAMTGQDAVTMAQRFEAEVGYDGVILTKLDGDARGGAALSIRQVAGKPIVFCGVGERVDALEPFHPDRMASRILGMGDVLSLVEKAQAAVDAFPPPPGRAVHARRGGGRARRPRGVIAASAPGRSRRVAGRGDVRFSLFSTQGGRSAGPGRSCRRPPPPEPGRAAPASSGSGRRGS